MTLAYDHAGELHKDRRMKDPNLFKQRKECFYLTFYLTYEP